MHIRPCVYVVDDDVSVRESLELLIGTAGWIPVMFASAQAFLSHARPDVPGCLILDVELPDLNGLDLQACLDLDRDRLPIIFVTGHGDIPMTVRAMKAGAAEFFTKPFSPDALLDAVRHALDRSAAARDRAAELDALRARHATLTPRERQVMALVVAGLLNKQVASELGRTEMTIKAHRGQVMRKMRADSLADLVRIAGRLDLPVPTKP